MIIINKDCNAYIPQMQRIGLATHSAYTKYFIVQNFDIPF